MPRPHPNNPDVVKVALLYQRDSRQFINTLHVHDIAGWDLAKMNALAVLIVNW